MCGVSEAQGYEHLTCSQCGTELNRGALVYCANCLAHVQLEFEQRANGYQKIVDEMQSKLLARGSLEATLMESIEQEKILVANLEQKVAKIGQELEEIHLFHVASRGVGVALKEIGKKLEALEQSQHRDTERIIKEVNR